MSQSHARATLRDHLEFRRRLERERGPLAAETLKFFGLEDVDLALKELRFCGFELPNIHRGLKSLFGHWQQRLVGGADCMYYRGLWSPTYRRVQVRPGRYRTYLLSGSLFFELPDGSRRVVLLEEDHDPPQVVCTWMGPRGDEREMRRELGDLARWNRRHHYLRGQALRADGRLLGRRDPVSWEDVALDPQVRSTLEENTLGVLRRRAQFRANGIPLKRGVLLYGPPGTGKTMVGKALADSCGATFIWATAADMGCAGNLRVVFEMARKLRPSIVFLEDLDMFAGERGLGSNVTLGELLSQMDGLERNDGIVVVATTNDLAAIEPAIKERPSRFDVVLEVGLPALAARRRILARHLSRQEPTADLLDQAALLTQGLSGAQVREVAYRAIQSAILAGAVGKRCVARVTADGIRAAADQITGTVRRAPLGFRAAGL